MIELRYECDRARLGANLADKFAPLARDAETDAFLARWQERPHGFWQTTLHELLARFMSSYDAHGLLASYPMHLLSEQAWGELLGGERRATLLDVGAGAGYVTEQARAWFDRIVCTETSAKLAARLRARGFSVHERDLTVSGLGEQFDVVSCFNVLDRTERPLSLLAALAEHVRPGGRLLLSIPLPPSPHVHVAGGTRAPRERLPSVALDWETAARELSEQLFLAHGFEIVRIARVPYLSRGDRYASIYVLDAALWLLTPSVQASNLTFGSRSK